MPSTALTWKQQPDSGACQVINQAMAEQHSDQQLELHTAKPISDRQPHSNNAHAVLVDSRQQPVSVQGPAGILHLKVLQGVLQGLTVDRPW